MAWVSGRSGVCNWKWGMDGVYGLWLYSMRWRKIPVFRGFCGCGWNIERLFDGCLVHLSFRSTTTNGASRYMHRSKYKLSLQRPNWTRSLIIRDIFSNFGFLLTGWVSKNGRELRLCESFLRNEIRVLLMEPRQCWYHKDEQTGSKIGISSCFVITKFHYFSVDFA